MTEQDTHEIVNDVWSDLDDIFSQGVICRFRYYTGSDDGSNYDNQTVLSLSGNDVWTSGVVLPIGDNISNSSVGVLMEQGKIRMNDRVIMVKGDVETTDIMKIGLGSPVVEENSVIPIGVIQIPSYGKPAFKKIFARYLPLGSLSGE